MRKCTTHSVRAEGSKVVYEGTFELRNDPVGGHADDDYYTAIGQKLLITKEPDKDFGCYLVTIIPDEKDQTKNSHEQLF